MQRKLLSLTEGSLVPTMAPSLTSKGIWPLCTVQPLRSLPLKISWKAGSARSGSGLSLTKSDAGSMPLGQSLAGDSGGVSVQAVSVSNKAQRQVLNCLRGIVNRSVMFWLQ